MTDPQWQDLLRVINGELLDPLPAGLIVGSPWLPGWQVRRCSTTLGTTGPGCTPSGPTENLDAMCAAVGRAMPHPPGKRGTIAVDR